MSTSSANHRRNRSSIFGKVSFGPQASSYDQQDDASISRSPSSAGPMSRIRRRATDRSSGSLSSFSYVNPTPITDAPGPLLTHTESARQSGFDSNPPSPTPGSPVGSSRPSLSLSRRSIFGSIRGLRFSEDETPTGSPVSTASRSSSFLWKDFGSSKEDHIDIGKNRTVLHHGEAITNSGLFWKKREYLVLTETHLVRFKSQGKASDIFHTISPYPGKAGTVRHPASVNPENEDGVFGSAESSGERATAIPLQRIVAAFSLEEGRLAYTLDIHYLDDDHAASLSLQLSDTDARETWLKLIKTAANCARLRDSNPISLTLAEYAARIVEREHDYDVTKFKIYKIVKRTSVRSSSGSAPDEASNKLSATVCCLVIGVHKVHFIHLPRGLQRQSVTTLTDLGEGGSFGILNLAWVLVSNNDDTFTLAFRAPFQRPVQFHLASLAASEIAVQIRQSEVYLRPLWLHKPYTFVLPGHSDDGDVEQNTDQEDLGCFDRTLIAFCVAYGVNAGSIRYTINQSVEDSPQLELLAKANGDIYLPLELLAVLKTLRFNESFRSISFAGISFDSLNGLKDRDEKEDRYSGPSFNEEMRGITYDTEPTSPVLIHEIRAIAMTNTRLRRLDFSYCLGCSPATGHSHSKCDFIQALAPLCTTQSTNVDWIALNGMPLSDLDVQLLDEILAERSSHIRSIELNDCGLKEQHTWLLLNRLATHDNTLEAIEFAGNGPQLSPSILMQQFQPLNLVRKLNLTSAVLVADGTPLLPIRLLSSWRLEELRLCGIKLDDVTVHDLCKYLAQSQSEVLHELDLSSCGLTGFQSSDLMQSMTQSLEPNTARFMHLNITDNNIERGHDALVAAIAKGWAPTHLSMRSIEYESSDSLRKLLLAMASNRTIRCLDMAKLALPGEANTETCQALEHFFAHNQTLEDLDLSGESARLQSSRFGDGLRYALLGLKHNKKLQTLHIQHQKLDGRGAVALADVLKENNTLKQIYCEHNDMKLFGFTDIVNALTTNTSILYLPYFEEARAAALHQTQTHIAAAQQKSFSVSNSRPPEPSIRRAWTGLSLTSTNNPGKPSTPKVGAVPQWTDHDISAALRLVAEGWDDQMRRLQAFLERNWRLECGHDIMDLKGNLLNSTSVDDHGERPATACSLSAVFDKVMLQTTPTVEMSVELAYRSLSPASALLLESPVASHTPSTPPLGHVLQYKNTSPTLLATPPVTPRQQRFSSGDLQRSPPSTQTLPDSVEALHGVEIDTTPIFGGDPFDMTVAHTTSLRGGSSDSSGSSGSSVDARNTEDMEPDGDWLMMAKSPPETRQEVGLGLHVV